VNKGRMKITSLCRRNQGCRHPGKESAAARQLKTEGSMANAKRAASVQRLGEEFL